MVLTEDFTEIYHPRHILAHPDFHFLEPNEKAPADANIGAFYNEKHELKMAVKPRLKPGNGEVLVHVRATGICGSDVHWWKHGCIGDHFVTGECNAGHESAGEVVEVGEAVTEWKVGDRVAIEVGVPCMKPSCDECRTGRYNGCPDLVFFSTPPYHGTLTRYHVHPAKWLHRLPDNVSFEEGALCEPLVVALAGIERSNLRIADPVVICGAGPIGLVTLLAARAAGAEPIIITDLVESRLEVAKKLCPGVKTLQIQRGQTPKDVGESIKKAAGVPIKVCLECTGVESSIHAGTYALAFGGTVFIIGVGKFEQNYPLMHLHRMEIDVRAQYRYANQYPKALRLVAAGMVNLKPLLTHTFKLEDTLDAFNVAADPTAGAIKVQIHD